MNLTTAYWLIGWPGHLVFWLCGQSFSKWAERFAPAYDLPANNDPAPRPH